MLHLDYEFLATGRHTSLFAQDMSTAHKDLHTAIQGSAIAVIGAAGSIGFAVSKLLCTYKPKRLVLIDINENNLVEVLRDIRSDPQCQAPEDFTCLPIGMGTQEFHHYFNEARPFDYVFNLCAMKHVRSEKDRFSLLRMIDTNNLFLYDFLASLNYPLKKFFSVSSDKAVNPANLMGASKCLMEGIMSCFSEKHPWSSARFANVAFSQGSLPQGFLHRIEKKQAIAAPTDTKRYFISHEEAAQLCVLSCVLGKNQEVFFPKLESGLNESTFSELAVKLLQHLGYEPYLCHSQEEAKFKAAELISEKQWPCYFSESNTDGEKPFEEFFTKDDVLDTDRFQYVGVLKLENSLKERGSLLEFLSFHRQARETGLYKKEDYIHLLRGLVPGFQHRMQGASLDAKM